MRQMSCKREDYTASFACKRFMKQIADNVFQLPLAPRNSINCYIAEDMLIDAGTRHSFSKIYRSLQSHPVHTHLLTHAHPDHQGSSNRICHTFGIPLYCHEKETERTISGFAVGGYPSERHPIALIQQHCWSGKGCNVEGTLKDGDYVGSFRVIETPGHASGHISFYREADGILIAGDVVTNMHLLTTKPGLHLPPPIFTTDPHRNITSLQQLAALHPRVICFGHGPVLYNTAQQLERFAEKVSKSYAKRKIG